MISCKKYDNQETFRNILETSIKPEALQKWKVFTQWEKYKDFLSSILCTRGVAFKTFYRA